MTPEQEKIEKMAAWIRRHFGEHMEKHYREGKSINIRITGVIKEVWADDSKKPMGLDEIRGS